MKHQLSTQAPPHTLIPFLWISCPLPLNTPITNTVVYKLTTCTHSFCTCELPSFLKREGLISTRLPRLPWYALKTIQSQCRSRMTQFCACGGHYQYSWPVDHCSNNWDSWSSASMTERLWMKNPQHLNKNPTSTNSLMATIICYYTEC